MKKILQLIFLFTNAALFAQDKSIIDGRNYIEEVARLLPLDRCLLQLNQDEFVPGDTVFFSSILIRGNEQTNNKIGLYARIVKEDGTTIQGGFIKVQQYNAWGQLTLPDSIAEGLYALELVIKSANEIVLTSKNFVVSSKSVAIKSSFAWLDLEGNDLIDNVWRKVEVRSAEPGQKILLITKSKKIIAETKTDSLGRSTIEFSPDKNEIYLLSTKQGTLPIKRPLKDGIFLTDKTNSEGTKQVVLKVSTVSRFNKEPLNVYVIANGSVLVSSKLEFNQDTIRFLNIPKSIAQNSYQLIILDQSLRLVAEHEFEGQNYIGSIDCGDCTYSQRDSALVRLNFTNTQDDGAPSRFVFSAINSPVFENDFFRMSGAETNLLAHVLRLNLSIEEIRKLFPKNIRLKGRLVYSDTRLPTPDSTTIFFYLQKNFMGYETIVTNDGAFELVFLFDFFGADKLFWIAELNGRRLKNVTIDWDIQEKSSPIESIQIDLLGRVESRYARFRESVKFVDDSYSFFNKRTKKIIQRENPNGEFEDEFLGPDVSINVSDYVVFPTMVDLVREVVPNLQCRVVKGEQVVRVIFSNNAIKPLDDPLYIIDGQMTKSTPFFLSLKPADILTIKVTKDIYKLSRLGFLGKNGIVYVQTKIDRSNKLSTEEEIFVNGIIEPSYSWKLRPAYTNRRPDFKSTIFWQPYEVTDKFGVSEFWIKLSDDTGKMKFRVLAATLSGSSVLIEKEFEVLFKKN